MQHRSAEAPSLEPTPQVLVLSRAQGLPIALLDHLGLLDDALPFLVLLAFLEGLFLQKWLSMPLIKETSSWHAQSDSSLHGVGAGIRISSREWSDSSCNTYPQPCASP